MSIVSFDYFIFLIVAVIMYYVLPRRFQWAELLLFSLFFYWMAAVPGTFVYVTVSTLAAWAATNHLEKYRVQNGAHSSSKVCSFIIFASIALDIILWFVLKGTLFIEGAASVLGLSFSGNSGFPFIAALGMGYYTLQLIGYTLDCYWETVEVQKNPLKLLLFACFFPQMTTGPISHYTDLKGMYEYHTFSYLNIAHGAQRILWGLFKKLVIAERVGIAVNKVWSEFPASNDFKGLFIWIAFLVYPIQMYADFSGCMDIVIGTAELFDIKLVENFRNPFFSRTSQEFWQRWHISLGVWAKDYVLYPLIKSDWMVKLGKILRKKLGKKNGKFISTALGMLVLWLVMGIWHGAYKYILGVSLWYWIILMLGNYILPYSTMITGKLGFKTESFGWHVFQSLRTYIIYAVGAVFFRGGSISQSFRFIGELFKTFSRDKWNPWIFFDGHIILLDISYQDIVIVFFGVFLMFIVGVLREKYVYARNWLDEQPILFRWIVYISLLISVIIFGSYGPDYVADNFIYGNF